MYEYHVDGTQPTKKNVLFVFGSNKKGKHGGGAAKAALDHFGAVWGNGFGYQGSSYAIPTKEDYSTTMPIWEIQEYITEFVEYTNKYAEYAAGIMAIDPMEEPDQLFVTRIGCGLAGLKDEDIAPMFKGAKLCSFPEEWKEYLEADNPVPTEEE